MEREDIREGCECSCNGECHREDHCHCSFCESTSHEAATYNSLYPNLTMVDINVDDFNDWD